MASKSCIKCGRPLQPTEQHCPTCGHAVTSTAYNPRMARKDHLIVVGVLVIAAFVYLGYEAITPAGPPSGSDAEARSTEMYPPDMETFVENLPAEFESLVSMGNALMDQKKYVLAMECYSRALAQRPNDADVQVDMGTCQHALGKNEEAIASFTEALKNQPDHKIAKFNLGIVNYSLGDTAQAAQWWNRLLAENPPEDLKARTEAMLARLQGK